MTEKKQINLLLLADGFQFGGAEKLITDTANYLSKHYKNIDVFVVSTADEGKGEMVKYLNSNVIYLAINCKGKKFLSGIGRLRKFVKQNNITHIHSHLLNAMFIGRLIANKNTKVFNSYHNMLYDPKDIYYSKWRINLDKLTLKKSYTSFFCSRTVEKVVKNARGKSSNDFLLYNFPADYFYDAYEFHPENSLKIISVGSLKAIKNFEFLVKAFIKLKDKPVYIDFFSDGPSRPSLQKIIDENNLTKVRLMGRADINSGLHAKYDVFVMSSLSEGMPIALLESMTSGMPSILPDHLEVMKDLAKDSAFYYNINSEESFIQTINQILTDKTILIKMHEKAVKYSKEFSIQNHMDKLVSIYNSDK